MISLSVCGLEQHVSVWLNIAARPTHYLFLFAVTVGYNAPLEAA